MDGAVVPHGPRRVAAKHQVTVPEELLEAIGVHIGENVFWMLNPDKPGTLVLLPQTLVGRLIEKGWTAL